MPHAAGDEDGNSHPARQRNHKFESFTQRVARLKIDPIRRNRNRDRELDGDGDGLQSYFRTGLDRWRELNLSESFSNFVKEVESLCDNLPQILHHKSQIVALLLRYLEERNILSLEPLFDLISCLAHDLGLNFEQNFPEVLALVLDIAAKHKDIEVVEWGFSSLAWLFKYLSKLLVMDLRPIYDLMSKALGKNTSKPYIARFAAEALSFLMRKAASIYTKDPAPLQKIVRHILTDIERFALDNAPFSSKAEVYRYGIATLFATTIKGLGTELHSVAPAIYRCLTDKAVAEMSRWILRDVTTSCIHHTNEDTIGPLRQIIYECVDRLSNESLEDSIDVCLSLLETLVNVRNGTRVGDWQLFMSQLQKVAELITPSSLPRLQTQLARVVAVAFSAAPLEACISHLRLVNLLPSSLNPYDLTRLCLYEAELNRERLTRFFLPTFLNLLATMPQNSEHLYLFAALNISEASDGLGKPLHLPVTFQKHISRAISTAPSESNDLALKTNCLDLITGSYVSDSIKADIGSSLLLDFDTLDIDESDSEQKNLRFHLTTGLRFLLQNSENKYPWASIVRHLHVFARIPVYLQNLRNYLPLLERETAIAAIPVLTEEIVDNLASASKELRQLSLLLLQDLYTLQASQASTALNTALELENLSLDIKTARAASMLVRRLAEQYTAVEETSWLSKAIPTYCFGLLHFKLSQVWSESIDGLKQMSSRPNAEIAVTKTIFRWLSSTKSEKVTNGRQPTQAALKFNEFQCSAQVRTLARLGKLENESTYAELQLRSRYTEMQFVEPCVNNHSRVQALRVLKALPALAEKRSRQLVPIFLRQSYRLRQTILPENDQDTDENTEAVSVPEQSLSRQEQLSLLEIFGQFTNPRMLYQTSEVHNELLHYLASGDGKLQVTALKALATWKSSVLEKYLESLNNLLDENRFREELSSLLAKENERMDIGFHEILPILLRVLYGRAISRTGSTSSKGSLTSKRKAIFDALARLDSTAIEQFVGIALGPLSDLANQQIAAPVSGGTEIRNISQRQQLGTLTLLKEMIEILGDKIEPALYLIIPAVLFCGCETSDSDQDVASTMTKELRKLAVQCLTSISNRTSKTLTSNVVDQIIQTFVTPRLENFAAENSQSVSALLQLFGAWAASPDTALWLVSGDGRVLDAVTQILVAPAVKENTVLYVTDQILKPLAQLAKSDLEPTSNQVRNMVLGPNTEHMLERLGSLLNSSPEKRVLASALSLLAELANSVDSFSNIQALLRLAALLLTEPPNRVSSHSKNSILGFLSRFISLSRLSAGDELLQKLESSLVPLLLYSRGYASRMRCSQVLLSLADIDTDLQRPALICADLDAFSSTIVDEPDFNRRISAFQKLEHESQNFSARQWQPVLYSLLYHIQDTQELAIRTSASKSLKDFVKVAATAADHSPELFRLLDTIFLPNLRKGVTQASELVRLEYLSVFAEIVKSCPHWEKVNDLRPLLVNDDEEASFFNNILHIQQHRRLRALRRLAGEATKGQLQSANIAHFLIPLLEPFVLDQSEDKIEHNVIYETITTLGALSLGLEWPQFRAMFRRYTSYILTNPNLEKSAVRLLTMMTDSLSQLTPDHGEKVDPMSMELDRETVQKPSHRLLKTLPKGNKFSEDIGNSLAAPLREYVHQKDETLVSQRVPVAVTVAKLIMLLSNDQIVQRLPPLLTDVCQILRSRSQESRDLARKTLIEVSQAVGPAYFGFILKELRTALPRGYQLHVLSFSTHALLVANEQACQNGELDYCLPDIANIIMDDTFGVTGQEKDAEDYISQMREVKSNKSYDSTEIIARICSLGYVNKLIRPIMALLEEHIDLRMLKKADELLRRLGVGLLRNKAIGSQEALVLCFELLQQVFNRTKSSSAPALQDARTRRFLIAAKSLKSSSVAHGTASAVHKMGRFGLDLLRMVLGRHDYMQTPANLVGFLPIIGEAIMSNHEEVQVAVIRLLATIIRVPLEQLDKNAAVYVSEAMALIKNATSTSSESAQAALKLITALLRDRDNAKIKETDVAYILTRIKADIDEPDRQGIIFNFLKAVLHRKVIVAEVYDVMDSMAALMIQSQSSSSRDAARAVYIQFMVNYPQGKDRLKKQWEFLIRNLSYEFAEGRQSVMETLHILLGKVGAQVVQDIVTNFFAPVVLTAINDESTDCQKMATLLLKEFFEFSNDETESKLIKLVRSWLTQADSTLLLRTSLHVFSTYVDARRTKARKEVSSLKLRITEILKSIDYHDAFAEWEIAHSALQLLLKLVQTYPDALLNSDANDLWAATIPCSRFPQPKVKTAAARLLGLYFDDFARTNATVQSPQLPLRGSGGMFLNQDTIANVLRNSLFGLKAPMVSEELAKQLVENIVFLGRLSSAIPVESSVTPDMTDTDQDIDGFDAEDVSDDSDDDQESNNKSLKKYSTHPLAFLFFRVSGILRREPCSAKAAAMIPKTSAVQILQELCTSLPTPSLLPHMFSIILPLCLLTDPTTSTPFSTDNQFIDAVTEVTSKAQEILSLLQKKLGTPVFVDTVAKVREAVKQKREARRIKRRIDTVSAPEAAGLKRIKKRSQQREQKKQKNASYRAQRRGW